MPAANVTPIVSSTRRSARGFLAPGASVLWTRHRREPDRTPEIREWFVESGFAEVAFDSPGRDRFALGTIRLAVTPLPYVSDLRLFTFEPGRSISGSMDG